MAAADTARSGGVSADSYIGSLISLTSKYEIRYEGVLYNINTEESSIGLRNVRSFGTEGRKKDGPQIPPSDKIYEYILFRGSDIKDLQVKSSPPPAQPVPHPPLHNDPAIIQSHYPRPTVASATMPSSGSGTDLAGQSGISRASFQGNIPLYQPGGSLGSWGGSHALPSGNGSGLGMPMYWQGFYAPAGGLSHLQQPPLLRPTGLQMSTQAIQQPLQYPGINVPLAALPPNLSSGALNMTGGSVPIQPLSSNVPELSLPLPLVTSAGSVTSISLPSTSAPIQAEPLVTEPSQALPQNRTPITTSNIISSIPLEASQLSKPEPSVEPISNMVRTVSGQQSTYQPVSQSQPTSVSSSDVSRGEIVAPLVTPDQLVQPPTSSTPSSQPSQLRAQAASRDLDVKKAVPESSRKDQIEPKEKKVVAELKEPILPTPPERKISATNPQTHPHHNRGRGRGKGNGYSRPTTKFTEEFDFTAMNEKFNKDEVWGNLGKNKGSGHEREGGVIEDDGHDIEEEYFAESSKAEVKPVYVKDDFFDSLSCNTHNQEGRSGRTRFSEQLKIDAETFGDLPRHRTMNRGGRGGRGFRGARAGGSFYGRDYGYAGRGRGPGRGYPAHNWAS